MAKINSDGEPSQFGAQGIVRDATGALHEVDPSRNLDGTAVDGFESEDRDLSGAPARDEPTSATDGGIVPIFRDGEDGEDGTTDPLVDDAPDDQDDSDMPVAGRKPAARKSLAAKK